MHTVVLLLVDLAVLFLPGLVLGLLAGLRWGLAVVIAPLLTYGVTTLSASVSSVVAFPWGPAGLVVVTALVGVVVAAVRLLTTRGTPLRERLRIERPPLPARGDWLVIGGVLIGGALAAGVMLAGFGRLAAPNQDYDYMLHANVVRLIADTGNLAPREVRALTDWESNSFFYYPNTFHGLAAVVRDVTGASVFEVLNSQAMIVCLVAGLGLAGLLHRLRAPLFVTAATPVLLAGFASFPYDTLWRGPLLPFAVGVAVIPAFVLLLDVTVARRTVVSALVFGLAAAGLLGLHPSAALAAVLFGLVHLVLRWWGSVRALLPDLLVLAGSAVVALVVAVPAVLGALSTAGPDGQQVDWPAVETAGQATGDLLMLDHAAPAPQYWLAGLVLVGLLTLHRARYLWGWLVGTALMAGLFVMAASSDASIVETLTRPWWNDRWRFIAIAVLGLAPLAAHGLLSLAGFVHDVVRRVLGERAGRVSSRALTAAFAAAGLLVVVVASHGLYARTNEARMAGNYQHGSTLTPAEAAGMEWLGRHSDGGAIMNDANDGSAYLLAVAGLHPLFGRVVEPAGIPQMGRTQQLLLLHFNCLDSDPQVREAVQRLHIRYVFLGSGFVRDYMHRVPGLEGISASPSLQLVHSAQDVRVYAVHLPPAPTAPLAACTLPGGGATGTPGVSG